MNTSSLRISLAQYDIAWEDKKANLIYIEKVLEKLNGLTDLVVFPEMCTTGFTMNTHTFAETDDGETISCLKSLSKKYNVAICGSFIATDYANYFNRGFFITPYSEYYYDKKHLFRMGNEPKHFSAGKNRLVFELNGFNICLLICYDLRFPVWSRNIDNEYDLLIYVANWPEPRAKAWEALLTARAIENMSYVCGVNRIGKDGNNQNYDGRSKLIDPKGEEILNLPLNIEYIETACIYKSDLEILRNKFPVWKDADKFELK